jgi:enoyl-CoA hydratase/carnithine racemase
MGVRSSVIAIEDSADGVRRITLSRPEKRNALSEEIRAQLQAAVDELRERPDLRVVVIAGAGKDFSAGADLRDRTAPASDEVAARQATGRWQRLLDDLERIPQVTVASLQGNVIGGAALLATTCDLRVAATDLSFRIPEVALGIPLTWGGIPRLAREIGLSRARDLVMTGRPVHAAEALACALVHRVVAREELPAATDELVRSLVAQPPRALAMTVGGFRALGRDVSAPEVFWADADLLRTTLEGFARGAPPSDSS